MPVRRVPSWPLVPTLLAGCVAAPPAPVPAPVPATAPASAAPARPGYTDADVRFVQGMIGHHAQALAMTALVPERTAREDVRLLAERIEATQRTEIAMMRSWLRERGRSIPDSGASGAGAHAGHHGAPGDSLMPGMLTAREMAQLAAASGPAFDRLFLEYMIRHHEGALAMVGALFATPGAGQEPEMFRLASDVDADQRAEIRRMRAMLDALPADPPPR